MALGNDNSPSVTYGLAVAVKRNSRHSTHAVATCGRNLFFPWVFSAPTLVGVYRYEKMKFFYSYLQSLGSRHSPLPQPIHSAAKIYIVRDHSFNTWTIKDVRQETFRKFDPEGFKGASLGLCGAY